MDDELEAIRRARMAELQKAGNNDGQESQQDEQKQQVLSQILTGEARERLSRIRIVREDRARGVEELIMRMARSGQLQRKVTEPDLVQLLEQIKGPSGPRIVYSRRDEDDLEDEESKTAKQDSVDDEDDFFD